MDNLDRKFVDEQIMDVRENGFLDYRTDALPTWCPGCGYFGITQAVVEACNELNIKNENICAVSGIGCAGRYPFFMNVYGFHTIHGRSVPVASGIKLSRDELTVIAVAGDGDIMGIGGGHLPHIARKNIDITLLLFDNAIYGLTKGQTSSTTPSGQKTNSHPYGNPDNPLQPASLALAYGATFVARGFAGEVNPLKGIIKKGITHKGFSFIHIITPCVTFDKTNFTWKGLKGKFEEIPKNHDTGDHAEAMRLAQTPMMYLGTFFQEHREILLK